MLFVPVLLIWIVFKTVSSGKTTETFYAQCVVGVAVMYWFYFILPKRSEKNAKTNLYVENKSILSVDTERLSIQCLNDEKMILEVGKPLLEGLGYRVMTAQNGRESLEIHTRHAADIDLVLLDMIMPDMSGGETFDGMREINPDVKVILSSGYSVNGQAQKILDRGCSGFIQKPFTVRDISRKIQSIL